MTIRDAIDALSAPVDTSSERIDKILARVKRYRDHAVEVADHSGTLVDCEKARAIDALYRDCLYEAGEEG
jgi:hypothetical protein